MVLVPVGIITLSALPTVTYLSSTTCSEPSATSTPYPFGPIVPFNDLPLCAAKCGPLFDAQAECSPPVIGNVDVNCFCNSSRVAALGATSYSEGSNVCPTAECSVDDMGLVMKWFENICSPDSAFVFVTSTAMEPETVTVTATSYAHSINASYTTISASSSIISPSPIVAALAMQTSLNATAHASTSVSSLTSLIASQTSSHPSITAVKTSDGTTSLSRRSTNMFNLCGTLGLLGCILFLV